MNYLSHLFFSQRTPYSFTGNLMGDFKPKESLLNVLPIEVLNGIANHRLVDKTTDSFEPTKELKRRFSPQRRRYAGVVTDIAFDYFLIKHWQDFAVMELEEFIRLAYSGLMDTQHLMPPKMQQVTQKMVEFDLLSSYATLDGVAKSIDFVSKRIRFKNKMAGSITEVDENYEEIERVFLKLFVHVKKVVESAKLESNSNFP